MNAKALPSELQCGRCSRRACHTLSILSIWRRPSLCRTSGGRAESSRACKRRKISISFVLSEGCSRRLGPESVGAGAPGGCLPLLCVGPGCLLVGRRIDTDTCRLRQPLHNKTSTPFSFSPWWWCKKNNQRQAVGHGGWCGCAPLWRGARGRRWPAPSSPPTARPGTQTTAANPSAHP